MPKQTALPQLYDHSLCQSIELPGIVLMTIFSGTHLSLKVGVAFFSSEPLIQKSEKKIIFIKTTATNIVS